MKQQGRRGPLAGTVVLDMTRVLSGPFCGMTLYNMGATVIKIERPGSGDDARAFPPFIDGKPGYFDAINYGKKSIGLDLRDADDVVIFEQLLEKADVVLENFRPGVMDRLGFGWDAIHEKHPSVIYAAISGFGQDGPYSKFPAYDMVVQCMSGVVGVTGPKDGREPVRPGSSFGDIYAGLLAVAGINAALVNRENTGKGCKVDIAMLDGLISVMESFIARYSITKTDPKPIGSSHPSFAPFGVYDAADGPIAVSTVTNQQFVDLCRALEMSSLADDPRFQSINDRVQNMAALDEILQQNIAGRRRSDLEKALFELNVGCGRVQDVKQLVESDLMENRHMVVQFDDPDYEKRGVFTVGNPIKFDRYKEPEKWPAPPALDEHRGEILSWLDQESAS